MEYSLDTEFNMELKRHSEYVASVEFTIHSIYNNELRVRTILIWTVI